MEISSLSHIFIDDRSCSSLSHISIGDRLCSSCKLSSSRKFSLRASFHLQNLQNEDFGIHFLDLVLFFLFSYGEPVSFYERNFQHHLLMLNNGYIDTKAYF